MHFNDNQLTLCEWIQLADDLSQRVHGLCEAVDHRHPHAEETDEKVRHRQIHQVQVDGGPHGPVEGHGQDDADVAHQGDDEDEDVEGDLHVFLPREGLGEGRVVREVILAEVEFDRTLVDFIEGDLFDEFFHGWK